MPEKPSAADRASLRLEAAIQRHAGWQLEYDFALVVNDRKQLLARIAELEADRDQLETEWAVHVGQPGQPPILGAFDTEANAWVGAEAVRQAGSHRSAAISVRSRTVGPWRGP